MNGLEDARVKKYFVKKYIPKKLYGFLNSDEGEDVFFHLNSFQGGGGEDAPPVPPVVGEAVHVVLGEGGEKLRAETVKRVDTPLKVRATISRFNPKRGYGFAQDSEGISYYIHQSEMVRGHIPVKGKVVEFYVSTKDNQPRACHISFVGV